MAWPSIVAAAGTLEFVELRGALLPQIERIKSLERPGIDGIAFLKMGKKASASRLVGLALAANANGLKTLLDDLAALRGEKVTVIFQRGTTPESHPDVIVEEARELRTFGIGIGVGGPITNPKFGTEWEFSCRETMV